MSACRTTCLCRDCAPDDCTPTDCTCHDSGERCPTTAGEPCRAPE